MLTKRTIHASFGNYKNHVCQKKKKVRTEFMIFGKIQGPLYNFV